MKTNQNMLVRIGNHTLLIEHKTYMGSLTDVWKIGNSYRIAKGLPALDLSHFLRSPETLEFVSALENDMNLKTADSADLEVIESKGKKDGRVETIKSPLIKTKRGKGGGTWAHLYILLDAAARLDARFRLEMYKTFVESKILQWRDDGGDQFILLNIALESYLPNVTTPQIQIDCALKLKAKIRPDGDNWNTASYPQLKLRAELERKLVDLLKLGLVRDKAHLFELIDRL